MTVGKTRLGDFAMARSGDKGDGSNVGVFVQNEADYEFLVAFLQAYVFTVLTCMYLNDAVHPGH